LRGRQKTGENRMNPTRLKPILLLMCCAVLLLSACKKKKPAVPSQSNAPTITTAQQQPPTDKSTQNQSPAQDQDQPKPPQTSTAPPQLAKPAAAVHKPAPRPSSDKSSDKPVEMAANTPPKIVIQEGRADAPATGPAQTAPITSHTEAAHNQATTEQLQESTEANLRSIKRTLSAEEQKQVAQIRDFMAQSRQASTEGDLVRARNLAMKAHLLSDDLVKPR